MIGLLIALPTLFINFIYITVLYLRKAKKIEGSGGVKYARKKLQIVSKNLLRSILVKVDVEYEDKEKFMSLDSRDGIVFVSNHSSNFDIPILMENIPIDVGFVAKKEMETWPFFGIWMKLSRSVFLDRNNPREGIKAIKKAVETVKSGHPMFIFPQGTRTQGFGPGQFKKGSFKLVTEVNGYVVPVALKGSDSIQSSKGAAIKINKKIRVMIGRPIKLTDLSEEELKRINEILEDKVREMYEKI